jgi:mannosyl-3-phosphoglycerate phosphatase
VVTLNAKRLIVFTDLEGTLLDQNTYSYAASLRALRKLQTLKMPVVLCSSKTRAEIEPVWRELSLADPFIVENGGAIYFLPDYFPEAVPDARPANKVSTLKLGTHISELRAGLAEAARRLHIRVRSFGEMSQAEIVELTGLTKQQAQAAAEREFDEPFVIEEPSRERMLATALRMRGFTVTRGDRFFHLSRGSDKGKAARLLMDLYRKEADATLMSVGLGNSANDLALLLAVERPILIRNPDRSWDSTITQNIPGIRKTMSIGPEGWTESVEKLLAEIA